MQFDYGAAFVRIVFVTAVSVVVQKQAEAVIVVVGDQKGMVFPAQAWISVVVSSAVAESISVVCVSTHGPVDLIDVRGPKSGLFGGCLDDVLRGVIEMVRYVDECVVDGPRKVLLRRKLELAELFGQSFEERGEDHVVREAPLAGTLPFVGTGCAPAVLCQTHSRAGERLVLIA